MTSATDHDATRTLLTADQLDQRTRARVAFTIAKSSGRLVPEPCVRCGAGNTDGHHEDYSKPLDVVWLCRGCHVARHKEIGNWGRPASASTAEIASLVAGGEPTAAIAARYGITARRVRAIAAATGNAPARAGRPRTGAATHHTARGRAVLARLVELSAGEPEPALELLARLLAIAAALGVEPGAVLDGIATLEAWRL